MNKGNWLSKKPVIYSMLGLGIATLTAVNFWGWFFIKGIEEQTLTQLSQQSKRNGEVYALLIREKYGSENILSLGEDDIKLIALRSLLYEFKKTGNLTTIFTVSVDKQQYISDEIDPRKIDQIRSFSLNDSLFRKAVIGIQSGTELRHLADQYFLTTYVPITDDFEIPMAALIIESPAGLFSKLDFFRQSLFYFGLTGLVVIAVFAGIIVVAISRLFDVEGKLHQQNRLAQLGQMAAMVAHEIRNPLSIIKGSADVLQKKYSSEQDELFEFIPEEIDRLNRLVNDFLQFARKRDLALSPINIREVVESIVKQMDDPRVQLQMANDAPKLMLDNDSIKQVILNIIENARKAITENGRVIVRSSISQGRSPKFIIEIEDNGVGMTPETLEKIFEPFYSTRAAGSGLGMAITKQLVEQMKGQIFVASKEKHGSTVRLEFPAG